MFNRGCEPFRAGGIGAAGVGSVMGRGVVPEDKGELQVGPGKKGSGSKPGSEGQRDKVSLNMGGSASSQIGDD